MAAVPLHVVLALWTLVVATAGGAQAPAPASAAPRPTAEQFNRLAARHDPYVEKSRVLVLTDIANEPDDQMSMVRFLVYANEYDIEGLVAGTSTWMRNTVRPDVILKLIDAYGQVQPTLAAHAPGFPSAAALRPLVTTGQPSFGMAAVGAGKMSPGAELLIRAADKPDPRPLWVLAWGGANTLAEALLQVRDTRSPAALDTFVSRLRVYAISDQDDAGPWIRREFPALHYIAVPSTTDGDQYLPGDMDRHQRRPFLPQRRWRGLHDVHGRVGERQHSIQGSARSALHHAVLHP